MKWSPRILIPRGETERKRPTIAETEGSPTLAPAVDANGPDLAKGLGMSSFDALFAYDIVAEPMGLWFLTRELPTSEIVVRAAPTTRPGRPRKKSARRDDRERSASSQPPK